MLFIIHCNDCNEPTTNGNTAAGAFNYLLLGIGLQVAS